MVVIIRIEVDDVTRRALRRSAGQRGLATRSEVSSHVETAFETSIVDIVADERDLRAKREPIPYSVGGRTSGRRQRRTGVRQKAL